MKISLQKPSPAAVARFLDDQKGQNFSYENVGASREKAHEPPDGFDLDDQKTLVGRGPEAFEKAKNALRNWSQFPEPLAEILTKNAPLEVGETVAMNARLFGLNWLNAARIVYKIDEKDRFGFAYGTLTSHFERGEELFLIEKTASGDVFFTIRAFSRPRFWAARLAYPFARFGQKSFVARSFWKMRKMVGQLENGPRPALVSGFQTAIFGLAAWLVFAFLSFESWLGESISDIFIALAALVLSPLAVEIFEKRLAPSLPFFASKIEKTKPFLLPSALALAVGLWLEKGWIAAVLSSFWLFLTIFLAASAFFSFPKIEKNRPSSALFAGLAGLVFWPVGAAWATAFCLGFQPMGFSDQITGLTAVHFHFAGLFLPLALGVALTFFDQKTRSGKLGKVAVFSTVVAMPATAVGITFSHFGRGPILETLTATAMVAAGLSVALIFAKMAFFEQKRPEKWLFALASASLAGGMVLAFLYAVRSFWPTAGLDIPVMRALHGTLNSVGFAAPALVGLCWKSWRSASQLVDYQ